jgi:hypothetical protein
MHHHFRPDTTAFGPNTDRCVYIYTHIYIYLPVLWCSDLSRRFPHRVLRARPLISRGILLIDLAGEALLSLSLRLRGDGAVHGTQVLVPSTGKQAWQVVGLRTPRYTMIYQETTRRLQGHQQLCVLWEKLTVLAGMVGR